MLVFLYLLFLSAATKNDTIKKQLEEEQSNRPQNNWKLMRHSLDRVYFSSKRRVPNESDPLHNRR